MATKYELYHAHPAKDPFDIEPAILHLEQAVKWLAEALDLAKEGTIDSLLHYFEVGYTSGNWHFPTIATHYAHGIGQCLAKMLEDELLTGTGFHFRYDTRSPQSWNLFYTENGTDEKSEDYPVNDGRLVAMMSIWTREIHISIHFSDEYERIASIIEKRQKATQTISQQIEKERDWFEGYRRRPWVRWFRKERVRRGEAYFQRKQNLIKLDQQDIEKIESGREWLMRLEAVMPVLHRFEKYGFVIIPADFKTEMDCNEDEGN